MADSYKTSKQRKGRQHLRRDYGYGTRFRGQQKQSSLNTWGAGIGVLSTFASGVAWASKGIGENVQAHEDVSTGAKELYDSGIKSGEIVQGTKFVDPSADMSEWEKWFTAPDPSDTVSIGGREFNLSTVKEIGLQGELSSKLALKDFEGDKKSLFSSYGNILEDSLDPNLDPSDIVSIENPDAEWQNKSEASGFKAEAPNEETIDPYSILDSNPVSDDVQNSLVQFNQEKLDNPLSTLYDYSWTYDD